MIPAKYRCLECGFFTSEPNWSDASEAFYDVNGQVVLDHVHVPLCPTCNEPMQQLAEVPQ